MAFDFNQLVALWLYDVGPGPDIEPVLPEVLARQVKSWVTLNTTPNPFGYPPTHLLRVYLEPATLFGWSFGPFPGSLYWLSTYYDKSINYYWYLNGISPVFDEQETDVAAWYTTWLYAGFLEPPRE